MNYNKLPIPYPAADDYGSRKGFPTLAVVFHMAEGTNVAQYLARDPRRGVSVHYSIERKTSKWRDGQVVRLMPENRISGSINPKTLRNDNDAYFGAKHAKDALGKWHWNVNTVVITVEVAGRAKDGPTKAQRESMVALFRDIRKRYPRVVPLGHRDFQNVKPCPGTTAKIKAAFKAMGGHGLKYSPKPPKPTARERLEAEVAQLTDANRQLEERLSDARLPIEEVEVAARAALLDALHDWEEGERLP